MATKRLNKARQEIEEARSRLLLKKYIAYQADVGTRISALRKLIGTDMGEELHRHVIVSSIAALQTFHRGIIISIVDSSDVYKARAAANVSEKISLTEALAWLGDKTITFGELVAHNAPCNSVNDLISWLGNLLDCDIKQALTEAIDPLDRRNGKENAARIISNVDRLLKNLAETFRLRHIFAHEAAHDLVVDTDTCVRSLSAVKEWITGVEAVMWVTVYANYPLLTSEMNQHAFAEADAARKKLAIAQKQAMSAARLNGSASWLRANHFAWKRVTRDWFDNTYFNLDGTMWRSVGANDWAIAIRDRAELVSHWVKSQSPDGYADES